MDTPSFPQVELHERYLVTERSHFEGVDLTDLVADIAVVTTSLVERVSFEVVADGRGRGRSEDLEPDVGVPVVDLQLFVC